MLHVLEFQDVPCAFGNEGNAEVVPLETREMPHCCIGYGVKLERVGLLDDSDHLATYQHPDGFRVVNPSPCDGTESNALSGEFTVLRLVHGFLRVGSRVKLLLELNIVKGECSTKLSIL